MRAWFIAGLVVIITLPITAYEVAMHLEYWSRPKLQIRVIRILWMVPIYSVDAWFCLGFQVSHPVLDRRTAVHSMRLVACASLSM